jgi:hypothetical protein
MTTKPCKDCVAEGRPTRNILILNDKPVPGPRCHTHHYAKKRATKASNRSNYEQRVYNLNPEQSKRLSEFQNGKCWICQRADGSTRALSIDHDHSCCGKATAQTPACGKCNRGKLCGPCNDMLGHGRDDPNFFLRAAAYLLDPPMRKLQRTEYQG